MSFLASGVLLFEQNAAKLWLERGGGDLAERESIEPEEEA